MTPTGSISQTLAPATEVAGARVGTIEGKSRPPDSNPITPHLAERLAEYMAQKASGDLSAPDMTSSSLSGAPENGASTRYVNRGTVAIGSGEAASGTTTATPITAAAVALKRLLGAPSLTEELAVRASKTLRDAAIKTSTRSPRHAALALLLSDALAFTPVEELEARSASRGALLDGYRLLLAPFVGGGGEELVVQALIEDGWKLTPAFDAANFSELDPEAFE